MLETEFFSSSSSSISEEKERERERTSHSSRSSSPIYANISRMATTPKLSIIDQSDRILTFNIGGQIYSTKRSTIEDNVDPHSFLALLINSPIELDKHGHYFIDRDGKSFSHILNYFREKKLPFVKDNDELKQLLIEAKFYQIDRLMNEIENRFNRNNEKNQRELVGCSVVLISKLNDDRRVMKFMAPLKFIGLFSIEPIGERFLKIISSAFRDLQTIQCQFTFPFDEKLISCQPMNPLEKFVLAKQAKKMGLMVSYSEDYLYLPIERSGISRDELTALMSKKYRGKCLNSSIILDEGYKLVENWVLVADAMEEIYSNASLPSVH